MLSSVGSTAAVADPFGPVAEVGDEAGELVVAGDDDDLGVPVAQGRYGEVEVGSWCLTSANTENMRTRSGTLRNFARRVAIR